MSIDIYSLQTLALLAISGGALSFLLVNQLKASHRKKEITESLVTFSADGILVINKQSKIIRLSPIGEKFLGYKESEIIGKPVEIILPSWSSKKRMTCGVESSGNNCEHSYAKDRFIQTYALQKNGKKLAVRVSDDIYSDLSKNGEKILLFKPLTEADKLGLSELLSDKGAIISQNEFLSVISHELRTPMNGIVGYVDLFETDKMNEDQLGYLSQIKMATRSMTKLVDDIVDFVSIDSGAVQPKDEVLNVRSFVKSTFSVQETKINQKNLSISFEFADALPEAIVADRAIFRKMIYNLLEAVINYSSSEIVSIEIDWEAFKKEHADENTGVLIVRVFEHGSGCANCSGIGGTFHQMKNLAESDTITKCLGSTGYEIAIVNKIVNFMGGAIYSESMEDQGCELVIEIPARKAQGIGEVSEASVPESFPDEAEEDMQLDMEEAEEEEKICGCILLVEDTPINQEVMTAILEKDGHQVVIASNGREALDIINKQRFDLILMDIQMPVMNGVDASRAIREELKIDRNETPIIAVTAHAFKHDINSYLKNGIDDCIIKPVKPPSLREKVNMWLRGGESISI